MDWISDNIELIAFFGLGALIFFAIGYAFYLDKKRREALKMMAPRMGFTYVERDNSFINGHKHLKMFSRGHGHSFTNVMEGEKYGVKVMLGDYHYTTGSGKNATHHNYTICIIRDKELTLPNFFLRREFGFLDSIGKLFGGQDINFPQDEKFSSSFVLQGTIESETRRFFNDRVRKAFLKFASTTTQVEAQDDSLIIHRGLPLEPDQWGSLLKDTFEVYEVLKKPEGDLLD